MKDMKDKDNAWLAKLKGKPLSKGAWRPNIVKRPQNIMISEKQIRGIGVNHGK